MKFYNNNIKLLNMRKIDEFLNDELFNLNLDTLRESKEIDKQKSDLQHLVLNCDDAIAFFNEHKLFDKVNISKSDITHIYDYATKHNMPCPLVANYKRKPGKFAFRRWVKQLSEDFKNFDVTQVKSPYGGLHDTRLKEDGVWFPSAEDYEYVIAFSHNKINCENNEDDKNIEYVASKEKKPDSKLEQLLAFYAENEASCNMMVNILTNTVGNSTLKKLKNEAKVSDYWWTVGTFKSRHKNPNNTPKTDIISHDGKYRISLKNAEGSQLMSGGECECRATLMSFIDLITKESDRIMLKEVLSDGWITPKNDGRSFKEKRAAGEDLTEYDKNKNTLKSVVLPIIQRNEKFKKAIIREAITGELKFGGKEHNDCDSIATHVLTWDPINKDNNKLYTVDEYVEYCMKNASFAFESKSSNGSGYLAFRIPVK